MLVLQQQNDKQMEQQYKKIFNVDKAESQSNSRDFGNKKRKQIPAGEDDDEINFNSKRIHLSQVSSNDDHLVNMKAELDDEVDQLDE